MSNQNTPKENLDQQSENTEKSLLARNSKLLTAAIIIAVIAFGVFAVQYFYVQPKEEKAQSNLTLGLQYVEEAAQLNAQATSMTAMPDSLLTDSVKAAAENIKKQVADTYQKALNGDGRFPGFIKLSKESMTDAANIAAANAGLCYYNMNNYKEAIKYLEQFSPQDDKSLSAQYIAALANCYVAEKATDKAISAFQEAADIADNAILCPTYLLEAGKLFESQGKNEEALKIYQTIKSTYPESEIVTPQPIQGAFVALIDKYIERVSK